MKRRLPRNRVRRFFADIAAHTPFVGMLVLLVVLWLTFAGGMYLAEHDAPGSGINSYGDALYWGVAAFSTAGIADTPATGLGELVGALWIVVGSMLFFGAIVATVTSYFMRPMQRPHKRIIDTIEYNLEQLDQLSLAELDLLRDTVDTLIEHVEDLKARQQQPPP